MRLKIALVAAVLAIVLLGPTSARRVKQKPSHFAITTCDEQQTTCETACGGSNVCIDEKCFREKVECDKCEAQFTSCEAECAGAAPCITDCEGKFDKCQDDAKCSTELIVCEAMAAACGAIYVECITDCAGVPACEATCVDTQTDCEETYSDCENKFNECKGDDDDDDCDCKPPPECT